MQQRLAWSTIQLDGYDGTIYALPQMGNQIGSCEGPILFCLPYAAALVEWRWDTRQSSPNLTLESPGGKISDGGLQVFADDAFERRAGMSGEAAEAVSIMMESEASFDSAMGSRGYCQNPSKRVIVPEMRSQVANRRLQQLVVDGEVAANTRHLGGQYCRTGTSNSEIDKRIAQVNTA